MSYTRLISSSLIWAFPVEDLNMNDLSLCPDLLTLPPARVPTSIIDAVPFAAPEREAALFLPGDTLCCHQPDHSACVV